MRRGFTLVELLVAMTIIVILGMMTLAAVNFAANGDRIPGASRTVQSVMLGARDRALYAGEPRGVRLIADADNDALVTQFVWILQPGPLVPKHALDTATVWKDTTTGEWWFREARPAISNWKRLVERTMFPTEGKVRFSDKLRWYTYDSLQLHADGYVYGRLTREFASPGGSSDIVTNQNYEIEMAPIPVPNETPRDLPRGVAIDLESSRIPPGWYDSAAKTSIDRMDVMFNERGTVHGPVSALGVLSFVIVDAADYQTGFRVKHGITDVDGDGAIDERNANERILSLFTANGTVHASEPDETDIVTNGTAAGPPDGERDDAFMLAESGGEA